MGQRWKRGDLQAAEFTTLLDGLLEVLEAAEADLAVIARAYPLDATVLQTIARCEAYLRASREALTIARSSARGAPDLGFPMRFDA